MGYVIDWSCDLSFPPIRYVGEYEGEPLEIVTLHLIRHHVAVAATHLRAAERAMQDESSEAINRNGCSGDDTRGVPDAGQPG